MADSHYPTPTSNSIQKQQNFSKPSVHQKFKNVCKDLRILLRAWLFWLIMLIVVGLCLLGAGVWFILANPDLLKSDFNSILTGIFSAALYSVIAFVIYKIVRKIKSLKDKSEGN